tara:strand:- start:1489 stop:2199 length:711 start_codon:yes stop_codon:yes gene_type:complete
MTNQKFKNLSFTSLGVPTSQKDIDIPTGSSLSVVLTQPETKPIWKAFTLSKVTYDHMETNPTAWADKVTNPIIGYNVYKHLLDNYELDWLPKFAPALQQALNDEMNPNLGASTDFQKGLVIAMYNWCIEKYPAGTTGQVMENITGLAPKRVSNILSRVSCTYEELREEGMEISRFKNKVVINNKSVYFVKHTDTKLRGGYMPKWVATLINDYINEHYTSLTAGQFSLDPEHRGSVG